MERGKKDNNCGAKKYLRYDSIHQTKIRTKQAEKSFKEYGFEIKTFQVDNIGKVEYAQWLHPFESAKEIIWMTGNILR